MDPPEHRLSGQLSSCHQPGTGNTSATDFQPIGMLFRVLRNFLENGFAIGLRAPAPIPLRLAGIEHQPRHIVTAALSSTGDFVWPEPVSTPIAQLAQGHTAAHPTTKVAEGWPLGRAHLFQEQRRQIPRMQTVTDLAALSVESEVLQRLLPFVAVDPE